MDIYNALKKDHEELKSLLAELVELESDDDYRMILIDQIQGALVPHSRAEESVFYNALRAASSDRSDVFHSFKEHMEAETTLQGLKARNFTNIDWKPSALKLKEAIEHHISEEEGKIFTSAKNLFSDQEVEMMGSAFEKLKASVAQEGFLQTSFDLVVNLMPPRFVQQIKKLTSSQSSLDR